MKDPSFYVEGPYGTNLINSGDAQHSRERRLLSHAFSEKALRDQEDLIQSYVDLLVERLNGEISRSREPVDLCRWYNYTTFDIIGDLAYGEPFNCLQESEYHPWVRMVFSSAKAAALMRPILLYPFLAPLVKMFIPKKTLEMRMEHMKLSGLKVERRLKRETDRPDFMSFVLRYNDDRSMSEKEMKANAALLILAGSETTATLLSGCTYFLLSNPEVSSSIEKLPPRARTQ